MRSLLNSLGSPSWWVSVVVVGILINLVSAYLKPRIDLSWSDLYSRWRIRKNTKESARRQLIDAQVMELRENPHKQVLLALRILNLKFALILLLGFLLFIVVAILRLNGFLQPYTLGDYMRELLIGLVLVIVGIFVLLATIDCLIRIINQTSLLSKAEYFCEEPDDESNQKPE